MTGRGSQCSGLVTGWGSGGLEGLEGLFQPQRFWNPAALRGLKDPVSSLCIPLGWEDSLLPTDSTG